MFSHIGLVKAKQVCSHSIHTPESICVNIHIKLQAHTYILSLLYSVYMYMYTNLSPYIMHLNVSTVAYVKKKKTLNYMSASVKETIDQSCNNHNIIYWHHFAIKVRKLHVHTYTWSGHIPSEPETSLRLQFNRELYKIVTSLSLPTNGSNSKTCTGASWHLALPITIKLINNFFPRITQS